MKLYFNIKIITEEIIIYFKMSRAKTRADNQLFSLVDDKKIEPNFAHNPSRPTSVTAASFLPRYLTTSTFTRRIIV